MLASHHILDLVGKLDRPAAMPGRVEALRRANKTPMGGTTLSSNQTRFLTEVLGTAANTARPEQYNHPATTASLVAPRDTPLTAAELAWLDRLPRDPGQVSHQDAQTLASLVQSMRGTATAADRRLLRSIFDPVREMHDHNQAETEMRNAQQQQPPIPSSALGALADAIHTETPELEPDEALARASKLLREASDKRANKRSLAIGAAQDKLGAAKEQTRARTAVTA